MSEAEPTKADPPKRKRRWLQFSLRTLLIVTGLVAVICGYIGSQAKIVMERKAALGAIRGRAVILTDKGSTVDPSLFKEPPVEQSPGSGRCLAIRRLN
jgi:hypothetical protein